jgi:hypothetical protein
MGKQSKIKAARRANREKGIDDPTVPRLPPRAKTGAYVSQGDNDLFENPMTRAAIAALSEEDKERYRILGEHMFGSINFEDGQSLNNMPPPMAEAVAYVETQIRSGLHISMLEDNEKALLEDAYGDHWYERFNYIKEDLDDIVTLEFKEIN